ncbi:hypothetical protein GCM10027074_77700 [Streptomyces deserti]
MGAHEVTVMTRQPPAPRTARLASLVLSLLVALCACVGPSWSDTDYEEKVANTAEAGCSEHAVTGPGLLAAVARWLGRRNRSIPWNQVVQVQQRRLVVRPGAQRAAS